MIEIPAHETKAELFTYLKENREKLITEKKSAIKYADIVLCSAPITAKAVKSEDQEKGSITVKVVANSTNIMDSHMDVHIKGNYDQSISDKEGWMHLKDHERKSDSNVGIVQSVKATDINWKDLGIDKEGTTECLVYESEVLQDLNKGIYFRYKAGLINQHSIGMRYRELDMAINDKDSPKEKAVWDQYIGQIINREKAEEAGFFWVVKNVEIIECSAVMQGSNRATPTLEVKVKPKELVHILGNKERKEEGLEEIQQALKAQATFIIASANKIKRQRIK